MAASWRAPCNPNILLCYDPSYCPQLLHLVRCCSRERKIDGAAIGPIALKEGGVVETEVLDLGQGNLVLRIVVVEVCRLLQLGRTAVGARMPLLDILAGTGNGRHVWTHISSL